MKLMIFFSGVCVWFSIIIVLISMMLWMKLDLDIRGVCRIIGICEMIIWLVMVVSMKMYNVMNLLFIVVCFLGGDFVLFIIIMC